MRGASYTDCAMASGAHLEANAASRVCHSTGAGLVGPRAGGVHLAGAVDKVARARILAHLCPIAAPLVREAAIARLLATRRELFHTVPCGHLRACDACMRSEVRAFRFGAFSDEGYHLLERSQVLRRGRRGAERLRCKEDEQEELHLRTGHPLSIF